MLKSALSRYLVRRSSRNTILRLYCNKNTQDDSPDLSKPNKTDTKEDDKPNDLTSKINQLLMDMANEQKKSPENAVRFNLTTDDLGVDQKRLKEIRKIENMTDDDRIVEAAEVVADTLGDTSVKEELITKAFEKPSDLNWRELIAGMDVDNTKDSDPAFKRSAQVSHVLQRYEQRKRTIFDKDVKDSISRFKIEAVDLSSGKPLGIFKNESTAVGTELATFERLKQFELKLAVTHPPSNYFQKMIQWTEQGKIWKFPIDNEQGMDDEHKIHFSEHVFLENHLEGWCPSRGPIRHFMELVCVGLSKNPYYSVKEKKEHIYWFRDYFESKKELLLEVGAWDNAKQPSIAAQ